MTNIETMQRIASNLKAKYVAVEEMQVCTGNMKRALEANDENTFSKLLDSRKNLMDAVDRITAENVGLARELPGDTREKIQYILSGKSVGVAQGNPLETAIAQTQSRISLLMKKLINDNLAVDKLLRTKK
ncbi:MAG: hypothetical protein RR162_02945 [Oscillospiraceae bacterium]